MAAQFSLAKEASSGFSNASNYDKYRSSYTAESASKLLTKLSVAGQKNARIIELASGTGKFTELLVARPEQFEVLAIEPHDGMRDVLAKKNLGIKVLSGEASNIPASDGWADALIAAQV
jgi:ubiquinone/menaquinone biosynthesis C-methylase UbiE